LSEYKKVKKPFGYLTYYYYIGYTINNSSSIIIYHSPKGLKIMADQTTKNQPRINKIETTDDLISGRGGLTLFMRYVEQTQFYSLIENILGHIKTSKKGLSLFQFVKQMIAFIIDGTYMSIASFDKYKQDPGYSAILENKLDQMASSHQIKRFFHKLMDNKITNAIYRKIVHELLIWRLTIEKPSIIILGADTMVLNNDDAQQREGVEPTYKKKKGYQPLHISWGCYLIDVLFRSGSPPAGGFQSWDRFYGLCHLYCKANP
jgi:hypothetical protein